MANKKPMGVSQWKEHGKKYGYWDYFKKDSKEKLREEIKDVIGYYLFVSILFMFTITGVIFFLLYLIKFIFKI